MSNSTKYIFVTGGVASSLGKGIISASLGKLLKARGIKTTIQKLDPYINIDSGTLDPYEHGESYVTSDGAETDLDLGHYERFLNITTTKANIVTSGRIYQSVIDKERRREYNGKTVQVIPHITNAIKESIIGANVNDEYDVVICEIGGTVGDMESLPYIEALRQLKWEHAGNCISIHLTLVPYLRAAGELKTKPTQHAVKQLLELGIQPDVLCCRTEHKLDLELRQKIALFCNINPEAVIEALDASTIYEVPIMMHDAGLDEVVLKKLDLPLNIKPDLTSWNAFLNDYKNPTSEITIGLVGKYVELKDAYKSINEAFIHGGTANHCKVNIEWLHSENITESNVNEILGEVDGILVAPGFSIRGMAGKISAVKYARENNIPFLGICLGMQCAVIEFARNIVGWKDAHTAEMSVDTNYPVINAMEENITAGSDQRIMQLGLYKSKLTKGSKIREAYNSEIIEERHRHRYGVNKEYIDELAKNGMKMTGINMESGHVDVIELDNHPWFVGIQYHAEFKSTVDCPHPLFTHFVKGVMDNIKQSNK